MTNITTVNLTNGSPAGPAGSSTVSTLDNLILVGSPIKDGISANVATVAQFHNADGQVLPGTAFGILTGGVDQLINGSGNLDRKRGVSGDGMAATGLAAEAPMVWNGATYDRQRGNVDTAAL